MTAIKHDQMIRVVIQLSKNDYNIIKHAYASLATAVACGVQIIIGVCDPKHSFTCTN